MGSYIESSNTESDRISNSIESLKYSMDRIYSVTEYFVLFDDSIFEDRISNYFEYRILGDSVTLLPTLSTLGTTKMVNHFLQKVWKLRSKNKLHMKVDIGARFIRLCGILKNIFLNWLIDQVNQKMCFYSYFNILGLFYFYHIHELRYCR